MRNMSAGEYNSSDLKLLREDLLKVYGEVVVDTQEARNGLVQNIISQLLQDLQGRRYVKELFYTGSAYEKLSVGSDHDFDIDVFMNIPGTTVRDIVCEADFVKLEYWRSMFSLRIPDFTQLLITQEGKTYYSAVKVRNLLKSSVDSMLSKNQYQLYYKRKPCRVTRSMHGPAVTIEIRHDDYGWISVDLVVGIRDSYGQSYKAKPYSKADPDDETLSMFWRKSYSEQERQILDGCDRGNQVRRKVLRIFKAIKKRNAQLNALPSYVYKNVLLHVMKEQRDWSDSALSIRFRDYIVKLQSMLSQGVVPIYFNPKVNVIKMENQRHAIQVASYLQRLLNRTHLEGLRELVSGDHYVAQPNRQSSPDESQSYCLIM